MKKLLLIVLLASACAGVSPRAKLVVSHQGIQTLLASVDDSERLLCFGSVTLPVDPSVCSTAAMKVGLTNDRHRSIRRSFVKAFNAQIALGVVIGTWVPGEPLDMSQLLLAVEEIDVQLALMNIKSPDISNFIQSILRWKAEIEKLKSLFGGNL